MEKYHILRKRIKSGEYLVNLDCNYSTMQEVEKMIKEMLTDDADGIISKYEYFIVKVM